MINDLVVINSNRVPAFRNEELNESVRRIEVYARNAKVAYLQIAFELKVIKDNELYKDDGYSSVVEFAERVLNCSKSTTNRMIQVADSFLVNEGTKIKSVFAQGEEDFSFNQLREALSLGRQEVERLVNSGKLLPSMTVKEIRTVVQEEKNKEEKADSDSTIDVTANSIVSSLQSDNNSASESEDSQEHVQATISSASSSSVIPSDTSILESIPSDIDKSTLAILMPSTSSSSVSGDPSTALRMPQESLSEGLGISTTQSNETAPTEGHELRNSEIDFLINRINEESPEEEYPITPYEYSYFNLSTEQREMKRVEEVEIRDLVMSDRGISTELKDCFELLKKEIKRLKYFSTIESKRLEEQEKEIARLKEENYNLSHPVKRGRGRPRKNQ